MAGNACQVDIGNNTYWIPCDRLNDLHYLDGYLVNLSDTSLTLRVRYSYETVYPYISCNAFSTCSIRTSQNITSQPVTSNYSFDGDIFKTLHFEYWVLFLMFLLLGVKLIWKR